MLTCNGDNRLNTPRFPCRDCLELVLQLLRTAEIDSTVLSIAWETGACVKTKATGKHINFMRKVHLQNTFK